MLIFTTVACGYFYIIPLHGTIAKAASILTGNPRFVDEVSENVPIEIVAGYFVFVRCIFSQLKVFRKGSQILQMNFILLGARKVNDGKARNNQCVNENRFFHDDGLFNDRTKFRTGIESIKIKLQSRWFSG